MVGGNEFMFMNFVLRQYVISHPGLVSAQIQRDIRGDRETRANLLAAWEDPETSIRVVCWRANVPQRCHCGHGTWATKIDCMIWLVWIQRREIRSFFLETDMSYIPQQDPDVIF